MMNDKYQHKIGQDVTRTKKDLLALGNDSVAGLSNMFEQLADDTQKKVSGAVESVGKGVEQGLSQYNSKVQELADRIPGNFGKNAAGYPWVTITASLAFGLLLGALLKPGRQPAG